MGQIIAFANQKGGVGKSTMTVQGAFYYALRKGKKVLVVCNLAPRKIAGIESQGMVLAAEDESGEMLSLLTPDNKDMPSGAEVC